MVAFLPWSFWHIIFNELVVDVMAKQFGTVINAVVVVIKVILPVIQFCSNKSFLLAFKFY